MKAIFIHTCRSWHQPRFNWKISFMKIGALTAVIIISCLSTECIGQGTGKSQIKQEGRLYKIQVQKTVLEIDPTTGGRITSLTLGGKNFLTDSSVNNFNYGSTFWLSPQSDWNWPPSSEIDNKPYSAKIKKGQLIMTSLKDEKTGIIVTKAFKGDSKTGSFVLKYTITNHSVNPQKVAPWEVTRVHTNGLAFFPIGTEDIRGGLATLIITKDGIAWFPYKAEKLPLEGDRQIYTDGSGGWLSQINNNVLLIQQFSDISAEKTAPKEGEIELYTSPVKLGKSYVEIEHQGEYKQLAPGESSTWEVRWYLRKLPNNVEGLIGSSSVVSYVEKLIK